LAACAHMWNAYQKISLDFHMKDVLFRSYSPRKTFTETIMLKVNNTAETSDFFLLKRCSAEYILFLNT